MKYHKITHKQAEQFNHMLSVLKTIAHRYQTPQQLQKNSQSDWGLGYTESLEMAYENILNDASQAIKRVRPILTEEK